MNSQNGFNSYNNQIQFNPDYNNLNNNYCEQYNNNYSYQNNYPQYNNDFNQYGNIIKYHNNYPVYSYIPPSFPSQSNNETKMIKEKEQNKDKQVKRGILLNIKKQDMCFLRPPEYQPGYIGPAFGIPKYAQNPPK